MRHAVAMLALLSLLASPAHPGLRSRSVFVEGEDFTPAGSGWTSGAGWDDDIYSPATSGDAVLANDGDNRAEATASVVIPETATFFVWVRYLKVGDYVGSFGLRVAQRGQTVFDETYRSHPTGHEWSPLWEKFPAHLEAGPATLTLYIAVPGMRQRVDCVLLTPDAAYQPDHRDFGPTTFARVRTAPSSPPMQARMDVYLRRPPTFYLFPGWVTPSGLARTAGAPLRPGEWSPWLDLSPYMDSGSWQATVKLAFLSDGKPAARVDVDWEVGSSPDPRTARTFHEDTEGDISSLILPGDAKRYPNVVSLASTLSQIRRRKVAALGLPPMTRTTIPLETQISGWGDAFRSRATLRAEMDAAHEVGANVFNDVFGVRAEVAADVGVHRGYLGDFFPGSILQCPTAATNGKVVDDFYSARARAITSSDPWAFGRNYRNILYDEPGTSSLGHMAVCASCRAGFVEYLRAHGLRSEDFHQPTWDMVRPIERSLAVDGATRKLHYWSIQYRDFTNASLVKLASDACRRHYGDEMLTMVNFIDEPISGWSSGMVAGPDWFLYGRLGATTGLWSEDYTSFGPEGSGLIVDVMRAAARPRHLPIGMYITAKEPETLPQRTWSALMHGAKMLHFYTWGPYYAFGDGIISEREVAQRAVGRAARAVAAVDRVLAPGAVPRAGVAILWGKSHEIWEDDSAVGTERRAIYLACQQEHVPVDILSEDDVSDGLLAHDKVLYVNETNVTQGAANAIATWVTAGGVLHMGAGAGMKDAYDAPIRTLLDLAGVSVASVEKPRGDYRERQGVPYMAARGTVRLPAGVYWPAVSFPVEGYVETSSPRGAQVLATLPDGKPAVYLRHVGRGTVLRFAFMPGLGYWKSAKHLPLPGPTLGYLGYDAAERAVLTAALKLGRVTSPITVSDPTIEAQLLRGKEVDTVMLANWSSKPSRSVHVVVRGGGSYKEITSSEGTPIAVARSGSDVDVTMDVRDVDALILAR